MAGRTKEFNDYLYQYWLENFEEPCKYCSNYIPCLGEDCDQYEKYEKKSFFGGTLTCEDNNFGDCPKLRETPCATCNCINNFKWNGEVPTLY